jgi:hypothetical protein
VDYAKQNIVDMLRRAGFRDVAEKAIIELPDSVELEFLQKWAMEHGITRDVMISAMGGSP